MDRIVILIVGIAISIVASWYSIAGLTAIFAAAVIPIIIMGGVLEIGKIVTASWMFRNWKNIPFLMRTYFSFAVLVLMLITSMGIFGFLSKAHIDQTVSSGDNTLQIGVLNQRIEREQNKLNDANRVIVQLDKSVDALIKYDRIRGKDGAIAVRKSQTEERNTLNAIIESTAKEITKLRQDKLKLSKQQLKFEAEVGPVKYIAQLIYGDDPDQNLLEAAVRWVIILIVAVFDPLAIMMLLAATETFAWRRQDKELKDATIETLPSPLPLEENTEEPAEEAVAEPESEQPISDEKSDDEPAVVREEDIEPRIETGADIQEPAKNNKEHVTLHVEHIVLPEPDKEIIDNTREWQELYGDVVPAPVVFDEPDYVELDIEEEPPIIVPEQFNNKDVKHYEEDIPDEELAELEKDIFEWKEEDEGNPEKRAKRIWKRLNPDDTMKHHEQMFEHDEIDILPWQQYIEANDEELDQYTRSDFGTVFPKQPIKGDTYVRVDYLPSKLYKWNSTAWIEINKDNTDTFAYNEEYIQHLIAKLGSGEYDPELLNDAERSQIELQLKSQDL